MSSVPVQRRRPGLGCTAAPTSFSVSTTMTATQSTGISGLPPLALSVVASVLQPACVLDGVQGYVAMLPPAVQVSSGGTVNRYMILIKFITLIYGDSGDVLDVSYIRQDCSRFAASLQAQLAAPSGALYAAILAALNNFLAPTTLTALEFSAVTCGP